MSGNAVILGLGTLPVTSAAPTGAAGGDLAGTYPNPTIKPSVTLTTPVLGTATATAITSGNLTDSALTSGRITTAGTAGLLTDYAGLAIVGTPSATAPDAGTNGPGTVSGSAILAGADGAGSLFIPVAFKNGSAGLTGVLGYACQGTAASPGATILNDKVGLLLRGHDGTNFTATQGQIDIRAGSTWTPTSRESLILFNTTANGSTNSINRATVASGGQVLVGTAVTTALATLTGGTITPAIQTQGVSSQTGSIAGYSYVNNTLGPALYLAKSRGATVGTAGVVTAGDALGTISFQGDDGTNLSEGASLVAQAEGTIAAGQVPGRLRVLTHNSAGTNTQAAFVDSSQVLALTTSTATPSAVIASGTVTPKLQIGGTTVGTAASMNALYVANAIGPSIYLAKSRSGTVFTGMTLVNASDALGTIDFQGADGTNFVSGAQIVATATGTPALTRMGSSLLLKTATDAAPSVMTTALTIDNTQGSTFAGAVTITANTDSTLTTGYGKLGLATSGTSTAFHVAQASNYNSTDYALRQNASGGTSVNSKTGQSVLLTVNASQKFAVSSTSATFSSGVPVTVSDTTNATTAATGAEINSGGLGVAKNVIVGFGIHEGVASTVTAAGTTTLTNASLGVQIFTGSTTQSLQMPAANLFGAGISVMYTVVNRSSGTVTAQRAGSDTFNAAATTFACATLTVTNFYSDGVSAWYTK